MPHQAYGWNHQQVRAQLLAELAAVGIAPCGICGRAMTPGMQLHVHHSDPAAKQAGLPGDVLTHQRCNLSYGDGTGKRATAAAMTAADGAVTVLPRPPGHQCAAETCVYRVPGSASRCW